MTNDAQHVGPIIFSNETARRQLVEEGEVITFRKTRRTIGETWWRESRTGPKKGDVTVEYVCPVAPFDYDDQMSTRDATGNRIEDYAHLSGFKSVEAWRAAIYELNGGPCSGHLYRVTEGHDAG